MQKESKEQQIQRLISDKFQELSINQTFKSKQSTPVHTIRGIVILLDVTKPVGMKDFKPSRLAVSLIAIRQFVKVCKQSTPIVQFCLGLCSKGSCKIVQLMSFDSQSLDRQLNKVKLEQQSGCFSLQSALFQSIMSLDKLKTCYHREIVLIQSSPLTKDINNIFETIQLLKDSHVTFNVISMCGSTQVIKRSVQKLKGRYIIVHDISGFVNQMKILAKPPAFDPKSVKIQLVRMALVRKEELHDMKECLCHFEKFKTTFVCSYCHSTLCKQPPIQCAMCRTLLVMPTDLYNHTIS